MSAVDDLDQPPVLENEAALAAEHRQQFANDSDPQDNSDKDHQLEESFDEQDMVGEVVEGSDGELYLIANEDSEHHDGVVDINSVREVKIMMGGNEPAHMIYIDGKEEVSDDQSASGQEASNASVRSASVNEDTIYPQGMKGRRNRVYGSCRCNECGQTFVNTARLERHLAVHQIFGNFSCPLCSKTYKYEYNLFYHWRKTCRDLDDVFSINERKDLDVNTLRSAVDDLVRKKEDYGPMEVGLGPTVMRPTHYNKMLPGPSMLSSPYPSRRSIPCKACGVSLSPSHMSRHLDLHRGALGVDEQDNGCFYCDLCGLMFRQHFNLMKHWRSTCPELQANLPSEPIDDMQLKMIVSELLQTVIVDAAIPSSRELNLREKARQYDRTTADLNFPESCGSSSIIREMDQNRDYGGTESMVFTDDIIDDDGSIIGGSNISLNAHNRSKWVSSGLPVQCHECKRAFANAGRLERHMAGYHSSSGSHHCPLCGNRFKYDYNLLYHYRKSCPYTKAYIETDMRSQLDAQTLRKLVRSLASKDLRVTHPDITNPMDQKEEYGDNYVRREMLGRPEMMKNLPQIPPNRPGMPEGRGCPICGIVFYGLKVLERHVRAAHPQQEMLYDADQGVMRDVRSQTPDIVKQEVGNNQSFDDDTDGDAPPQLEKHSNIDGSTSGPLQIVDDHGNIISQVEDFNEVQRLIESGELGLRSSDRFIMVEPDGHNRAIANDSVYSEGSQGCD